ncbi:MAG: hypothetical protein Q8W46_04825 [Candidatus Palauibacterales bacterium]|nr:hypothetical protein [Candidatus Palauibacterales bacterium]
MNTSKMVALAGLAMLVVFATPLAAQDADVAKDQAATADEAAAKNNEMMQAHKEMMQSHKDMMQSQKGMMGEAAEGGCDCPCMQEMREKMMEAHAEGMAEGEANAEGMAHAEGMTQAQGMDHPEGDDSAEGMDHDQMMQAHAEMMANCECMDADGDDGAMSCKMHGGSGTMGEMKGEGMPHQHDMKADDADGDDEG